MLKVYNTMTRQKEEFKPLKKGEVSIYCCGVTPYNHPHIGNARPFVTWDVIRRYFAKKGYKVRYIQNFTDVDDKIINAANKEGVTWKDISDRYIKAYFEAMDALNVRHADVYPRVSETMPEIIAMVQKLIDKGYAYVVDNGDVYYSVEKFSHYGRLSGRSLDDMQAGARIEVNTAKHHPMDFALWKAAKPGEPSWADRAGTSSARQCPSNTSVRNSTSTAAAATSFSRITRTKSRSRRPALVMTTALPSTGCTTVSSRFTTKRCRSRRTISSRSKIS